MINIVHISAHLGGGVGKILSSVAIQSKEETEFEHIIIMLEPTQNSHFEEICKQNGVKVYLACECDVNLILEQADIVQVDWWHHPLVSQFLVTQLSKITCKLIVWSHISGCLYPYIQPKFVLLPDAFVFATPFSYENPFWDDEEREKIVSRSYVVASSGIDFQDTIERKRHQGFNVGYIGFLSYNKTHPEFVKYCESASDIPDIKYIIVGDTNFGEHLIKDVQNSDSIRDKVIFTGYSRNVFNDLSEFDIFGYPLNPEHTGTAENALLEAMGAGVVPVVLNQCTEKYLVKHMKTGLVVNSINEYADALNWLYRNPHDRVELGKNASRYILKEYHIKATIAKMNRVYEDILKKDKSYHNFEPILGTTAYEWFKACYVGDENNIQGNAFAETKGSAKQYLKYFVHDYKLRRMVENNESRIKA